VDHLSISLTLSRYRLSRVETDLDDELFCCTGLETVALAESKKDTIVSMHTEDNSFNSVGPTFSRIGSKSIRGLEIKAGG